MMTVSTLWPIFVFVVKVYAIYGCIFLLIRNLQDWDAYNSGSLAIFTYITHFGIPLLVLVYHHTCS